MVTVGVSGHRDLIDVNVLSRAVDQALEKILAAYHAESMRVVSPLAEGADRLVAQRAMDGYGAQLIVPIPFERSMYMRDFESRASKKEFRDLIGLAEEVIELPEQESREASYYAVGLCVLDHCDVLITIWDGKPARGGGGTAQIVEEARRQGKPVAWIQVDRRGEENTPGSDPAVSRVQVQYEGFPDPVSDKKQIDDD